MAKKYPLVWLGNHGHLSPEKQQELVWELGAIEIGTGTLDFSVYIGCHWLSPNGKLLAALVRWSDLGKLLK